MIGDRRVGQIMRGAPWHVAVNAAIVRFRLPIRDGKTAALLLVAYQTALAKEARTLVRRRLGVWIVATDAAQLAGAGLKAAARCHLLNLTDKFRRAAKFRRRNEHRQIPMQRQAGSVIVRLSAAALNAVAAFQMTLLADRIA